MQISTQKLWELLCVALIAISLTPPLQAFSNSFYNNFSTVSDNVKSDNETHISSLQRKKTNILKNTFRTGIKYLEGEDTVMVNDSLAVVAMVQAGIGTYENKPLKDWSWLKVEDQRVIEINYPTIYYNTVLPDEFYLLKKLEIFKINGRSAYTPNFVITDSITRLKNLREIEVISGYNEVSFSFLPSLDKLVNLEVLRIKGRVKGNFPASLTALKNLKVLSISTDYNSKAGNLPDDVTSLTELEEIHLELLNIQKIPANIGNLANLKKLIIKSRYDTHISGSIPASIGKCTQLEELSISEGNLRGPIPAELFSLSSLKTIDLSYNSLEILPQNLFETQAETVNLRGNRLESLPKSIDASKLPENPTNFNLSGNWLSGELPGWFSQYELNIDLSYNNLSGNVPVFKGIVQLNNNSFTDIIQQDDHVKEYEFSLAGNYFSFEDLIPNKDKVSVLGPQKDRYLSIYHGIPYGASDEIQLGFDEEVTSSTYYWFKDDIPVDTTTQPVLKIEDMSDEDVGDYEVYIYNSEVAEATLLVRGISVYYGSRSFQPIAYEEEQKISTTDTTATITVRPDAGFPEKVELTIAQDNGVIQLDSSYVNELGEFVQLIQPLKSGEAIINGYHPGSARYYERQFTITIKVSKSQQTITFDEIEDQPYEANEDKQINLLATSDSGLPVSFRITAGDNIATLEGNRITYSNVGQITVEAFQQGDERFNPAKSVSRTINIIKREQQLILDTIPDLVYGMSAVGLFASSDQGLKPSYAVTNGTDLITIEGDSLYIHGAGEATLEITQSGNDTIAAAETIIQKLNIAKMPVIITFEDIEDKQEDGDSFTLKAYTNTPAAIVAYRIVEGESKVKLESNQVSIIEAGEVVIEAYYEGDANHEAAASVTQSFRIIKAEAKDQTITVLRDIPETLTIGDTLHLKASSTSGLEVTIEATGSGDVEDGILTASKAGSIKLTFSQPGNEEYNAAKSVVYTIDVLPNTQKQIITIESDLPDILGVGESIEIEATASSDLEVNVQVEGPATLTNNVLTTNGEGIITLIFSQEGNEQYDPAEKITHTITVKKIVQEQTISVVTNIPKTLGVGKSLELQASASSGLKVSIKVEGPATLKGNVLTTNEEGTVKLTFEQDGNEDYFAAEPITRTIKVVKNSREQTITVITIIPEAMSIGERLSLEAISSSGLNVDIQVNGPATLSDGVLQVSEEGIITLAFMQEGNKEYDAAETIRYTINATRKSQTITFKNIPPVYQNQGSVRIPVTSSSGLDIELFIISGKGEIDGLNLILESSYVGIIKLLAIQEGNNEYVPVQAEYELEVLKAKDGDPLVFTYQYTAIDNMTYGDDPIAFPVSIKEGYEPIVEVEGPATYDAEKGTITALKAGEVKVRVYCKEDTSGGESFIFKISHASQQITFSTVQLTDSTFLLNAVSNIGNPISYSITEGNATISNDTLTAHSSGTIKITAYVEGDEYYAAESAEETLDVQLVLGIVRVDERLLLKAYPNPMENVVNIQVESAGNNMPYHLYSTQGKILRKGFVEENQIKLYVDTLPAGVYSLGVFYEQDWHFLQLVKQ